MSDTFESASAQHPVWEVQPLRAGMSMMVPATKPNALKPVAEPHTNGHAPDLKHAKRRVMDSGRLVDDRLPPHSPEAEAGVLGCCLLSPVAGIPATLAKVAGDDAFYDLRNRTIWDCLRALHKLDTPIDTISCQQWLKDNQLLEGVGGIAYLNSLQDSVPSAANLSYYLDILTEKHTVRKLIHTCTDAVSRVYEHQGDVRELLDSVERDIGRVSDGPRGNLPAIIPAEDFIKVEIVPPTELVKGLIHKGTKTMLGGGSKSFKTWILLDLALSVAYGVDWLGFKTEQGRVLFVNFEIQPSFFQQRMMHVAYHKGLKLRDNWFHVWNLRGYSAPYQVIIPKILERIRRENYALVILDPIYMLYGDADENSAADMANVLAGLESISTQAGAAIAFGAHYSKGDQSKKEAIDRVSGSGVFGRNPDSLIPFTRHEEDDAFVVEPVVRNLEPVDPFVVRWQFPLMQRADQLDPAKLRQGPGRPPDFTCDQLIPLLGDSGLTSEEWEKSALKNLKMSRATFFRLRTQAKATDLVIKSHIDDKWKAVSLR